MLWTHAAMVVPGFEGRTAVKLAVPTSFDLSLAPTKYFFALDDGEVPLTFQFSGTVFYRDAQGALMTERISWAKEARFRLPVAVWRDLIERHYPDGAWLCLRRDVFDRLYRYKARRAVPTWDAVIDELLRDRQAPRSAREPRTGRPHRRGHAVRGVHPLPVPAQLGEEPGALDVRRRLPARVRRGRRRRRAVGGVHGMPAPGRG